MENNRIEEEEEEEENNRIVVVEAYINVEHYTHSVSSH